MAWVRIINGTYAYRPEGAKRLSPVSAGSSPIEVSENEAARLVRLGVAERVAADTDDQDTEEYEDEEPKYNAGMKAAELQAIMEAAGLEHKAGMTKAEMVAALDSFYDENDNSGDDPPPAFEPEEPTV